MVIDAKELNEVYVKKIQLVADDERFYSIQGNNDHALSTYGRLYRHKNGHWNKVSMVFRQGGECYQIGDETIPVHALMAKVFFPEKEGLYLYPYNFSPWNSKRWNIENLLALENREDIIEVIKSKIEHREPQIDNEKKRHLFINRAEFSAPVNEVMARQYYNMRSRATNKKFKDRNHNYRDTTISEEWLNDPEKFYSHMLKCQYYYPEKLTIDKDLLGLGEANQYAPEYVVPLPTYINNIFTSSTSKLGYCIQKKEYSDGSTKYILPQTAFSVRGERLSDQRFDKYTDALVAGRKRKADYIRRIVEVESKAGFIPEYILCAMRRWADRCELGLVKIWEPTEEILREMGLL